MNAVSRRGFLGIAATTSVAALAACAMINPNNTPQENMVQVVADVTNIANAFARSLPQITALSLSANTKAMISADVSDLNAVAKALTSAATTTTAQPLVQKVENDVNAVMDAVAALPGLPLALSGILQAATVLLPIIEASVGLAVPVATASRAKATGMTPDEARALLRLNS